MTKRMTIWWNFVFFTFALHASAEISTDCGTPSTYFYTKLDKKYLMKKKFSHGEKVYFDCAEDYVPSKGSRAVECVGGKWTTLTLKCEKKSCGNAGDLLNGQFEYEGNSVLGDKVHAVCNDGYTLSGMGYMICKSSGWTGEFPSCEVIPAEGTCSNPAVANATKTGEDVSVYRVGDSVTFICEQGFQLDGSQQVTCSSGGQWQPELPQCLPSDVIKCPELNVPHGRLSTKRRKVDSIITVTCNKGYSQNGPGRVVCSKDGKWSEIPQCVSGTCGVPANAFQSNAHLADSYTAMTSFNSGDKVFYMCDVGYVRAGGISSRKCLDGKWTALQLKCERKSCGSAGEILNGQFLYTGAEFGDIATGVCDEGYQLVGQGTRNCMSGGWDGRVPICDAVQCEEPPKVTDAVRTGTQEPPYMYSSVIGYRCLVGTLTGQREIWCTKKGTWSAPPPECKEISCLSPNVPYSSRIGALSMSYKYRDTVSFQCNRGYRMSGSSTVSCGDDGRWTPGLPHCRRYRY
ncbi:complement receptor type 2 isoform 2-T2 [Polymixia lowei]